MLGDWVFWARNHIDARGVAEIPVLLETILRCGVSVFCDDNLVFIRNEDIDPIPLTPEILEKNDLKPDAAEDAYAYRYQIGGVSIVECYANAGGRYRGIFAYGDTRLRITLRFVHELQHALRLCGIDKEIVL